LTALQKGGTAMGLTVYVVFWGVLAVVVLGLAIYRNLL
jgi:hypothetical protein